MIAPLYALRNPNECYHWVLELNWTLISFHHPELVRTTMLEF